MPGPDRMGYGYQWWIPREPDDDFMALGVYGQTIYVSPKDRVVIVKNSADRHFQDGDFENEEISLALWRTIVEDLRSRGDRPLAR
jgi:CubicO group peptidase (beta-lactamase class C family)